MSNEPEPNPAQVREVALTRLILDAAEMAGRVAVWAPESSASFQRFSRSLTRVRHRPERLDSAARGRIFLERQEAARMNPEEQARDPEATQEL